jgi:hypothetical protein
MAYPIIIIQSNPSAVYDINYDGICNVSSGQTVTFVVASGLSSGISVNYQWHLNDNLVGIGTGYTLTNPQEDDRVYVNIVNCGCSCGLDDKDFYFNDIIGSYQEHYLDLKASSNYYIQSIVLNSDVDMLYTSVSISGNTGPSDVIWINPTPPPSLSPSLYSNNSIKEYFAEFSNIVMEGNSVKIITQPGVNGTLTGKIKIIRF